MKLLHGDIAPMAFLVIAFFGDLAAAQNEVDLEAEQRAAKREEFQAAETLASKAIAAEPKSARAYADRALARDGLGKYSEAAEDMARAIELRPNVAQMHYTRGDLRFKAGDIAGSLADYDREIELAPERKQRHWQRGIVCYYAGKYADGAKQFAHYQTYDDNDVENVVWRFACMAQDVGVEKARAEMLKVRHDSRVPMMQIYDLFRGAAKPEEVLAAADRVDRKDGGEAANVVQLNYQQFYAHYYLGLYFECIGKPALARPHLLAAPKYKNDHYMWHVARIHAERLVKPDAE